MKITFNEYCHFHPPHIQKKMNDDWRYSDDHGILEHKH